MALHQLYQAFADQLEDFWGRRVNEPAFTRQVHLFGWPVHFSSNDEGVLSAVDVSLRLYSWAEPLAEEPLFIHIVVRKMANDPGEPPEELFDHIQYAGYGNWLTMHLGAWGLVYVDLEAGRATIVLTPSLACRPALVSRCVLNTVFNNLMESRRFSMLHCTSLVRDDRLLLLMGQHNSGKSTTALRLTLSGYAFVADSQIYVAPREDVLQLLGFPVGWSKLREDVLDDFSQLEPFLQREEVRDEVKFRVDLRRVDDVTVWEEAIVAPEGIELCILTRHNGSRTTATRARRAEVMEAVFHNGSFWHTRAFWEANLQRLQRLVDASHWHHVQIGTDSDGVLACIERLMER